MDDVRSVGNQPPASCKKAQWIDCGQPVPRCQLNEQITMIDRGRCSRYDQTAIWFACKRGNGLIDFGSIAYKKSTQFHSEGRCYTLDGRELWNASRVSRVLNDGHPVHSRRNL